MDKFEIGKVYEARSICNYDCIFTIEVLKRTAKFVTVKVNGYKEPKRVGIKINDGGEVCYALGTYSMAPIFRA